MKTYIVSYPGFMQTIIRIFHSRSRAIQWARQVGKLQSCTIQQIDQP